MDRLPRRGMRRTARLMPPSLRRRSVLVVAIAGSVAAGVAWLRLAIATGLVVHFS